MTSTNVDAAIAHHIDWPTPGVKIQKMSEIDLPRKSSGTEWWYYNFHLSLVDGRKASAFIALFRTTSLKPKLPPLKFRTNTDSTVPEDQEGEYELCHTHLVNFALSVLPQSSSADAATDGGNGRYFATSAMDHDNADLMRSMLEVDTRMDPLLQRSLLEVMRNGKIPEPDTFIPGDIFVSDEGSLDLRYGDLSSVVRRTNEVGDDVYHIVARAKDGSYGFEIDLTPRKPPINHGENGVVQGDLVTADDGMFYCFVPRCEVSGSVVVDHVTVEVKGNDSMGWYDREFGGAIRSWYEPSTRTTESSWKWASVQLSNDWDLTVYTLWDVDIYTGETIVRDKRAIAISPEGSRIECDDHTFDPVESWTSLTTLNEYGTKWKLTIPALDISLSVDAPFQKQEFRTLCTTRGYWEGRTSVAGTMGGVPVSGLGFVENVPAQFVAKFEKYIKRVGHLITKEVSKIYPDQFVDAKHATEVLAFESQHNIPARRAKNDSDYLPSLRFVQDIRLDVLHEHLFAPVRHLTDRGGKSWRSFLAIVCISVFGMDPERFKPLLAATELLHTGSLIIDDIQDESPMRRGVASVHTVWGIATAINAGTAAYFAFETAMRSMSQYLTSQQTIRIYEIFFETMRAAHTGQALDIAGQQQSDLDEIIAGRADISTLENQVLSVHRLKTAIIAANIAKIAAIIGNASPSQIRALATYFETVGIAFQIIDDVYDIRGWSHVASSKKENVEKKPQLKRRGDDIRSGKISIPVAKAGSRMPLKEAQWVWETVLSKPGDDDETTQKVIDKLESYGVVDICVKEAHGMVESAWANLEPHLTENQSKIVLRALGWYLVKYNSI